jgi:hypothetical protein
LDGQGLEHLKDVWAIIYGAGTVLVIIVVALVEARMKVSFLDRELTAEKKLNSENRVELRTEMARMREQADEERLSIKDSIQKILLSIQRVELKLGLDRSRRDTDGG